MAISKAGQSAAESYSRVQGVTGEQTIKSTPGVLHRIVCRGTAASLTLTINDGTGGGNVVTVVDVPNGSTETYEFNVKFGTDIRVTPSATTVDAAIIYS